MTRQSSTENGASRISFLDCQHTNRTEADYSTCYDCGNRVDISIQIYLATLCEEIATTDPDRCIEMIRTLEEILGIEELVTQIEGVGSNCICVRTCDCADFEGGLVSNECPEHNNPPRARPDCPAEHHYAASDGPGLEVAQSRRLEQHEGVLYEPTS